ncbi:MAG: hypothetical protein NE330_15040 [Lentisphaeraceae bacterium]|nr:hypothetical protein [Lentisphaeraceae bacterium]
MGEFTLLYIMTYMLCGMVSVLIVGSEKVSIEIPLMIAGPLSLIVLILHSIKLKRKRVNLQKDLDHGQN